MNKAKVGFERGCALAITVGICLLGQSAMAEVLPVPAVVKAASPQAAGSGLLSGIFGCAATGSKQEIGAVGGGALGGLLGNRIAGSGSRTVGTVVGAAIGAATGSAIGCRLQRSDQAKAEAAAHRSAASGQKVSWTSDDGKTTGSLEPDGSASAGTLAGLTLASNVVPAADYQMVGAYYLAKSTANLRSGPDLSYPVIGQLTPGQRLWVPASASGTPWMLMASDRTGRGYVSSTLLTQDGAQVSADGCRTLRHTVRTDSGDSTVENLKACKTQRGDWAIQRVT